ncbi:MAG: hypothetical protein K6A73_08430 [Bacteroidales bacterium]|nr:hypothetical protein [Bacteroidales bacterium]
MLSSNKNSINMNTTIKTNSEEQLKKIRRFVRDNNIYNKITKEKDLYTINLLYLSFPQSEKFIKSFIKTNHLTKIQQQEPKALAA